MKKVLVIDDDESVRSLVKFKLSKSYSIIEAENGKKGLELFLKENPDAIITDIIMPEEEGFKTIIEIRKVSKSIPIIAMTGMLRMGSMNPLDVATEFGANAGFNKPVNLKALTEKLAELMS